MADEKHGLPGSSIDELLRIIMGYASADKSAGLTDLSKLLGMNRTVISRNNAFLKDFGVISGGKQKEITEVGAKLGRALEHNQTEEIRNYLNKLLSEDEFLSNIVTTIRLKGGMDEETLIGHVLYVSGQDDNGTTRTGTRALLELLKMSGVISQENGTYSVTRAGDTKKQADATISENVVTPKVEVDQARSDSATGDSSKINQQPQIVINLQFQLPEAENPALYKDLFVALRKHLIDGEE